MTTCRLARLLSSTGAALRATLVLATLCLAQPSLAASEPVRLSKPEARDFALSLVKRGQFKAAKELSLALLRVNSRDYIALLVLAEAERALGRPTAAKFAARRAWRSSERDRDRFAAAFMMSNILKSEEKYGQAQIWLRRAGQATDSKSLDKAARQEFARLRAVNPWSVRLGLTLSPTSNVNGGPNDNTYTIGDLVFVDETAVPLSGVEIGTSLNISRRFQTEHLGQLRLGVFYSERRYILSKSAKAAVPTASGADYAFTTLEASFGTTLTGAKSSTETELALTFGQNWQASAPLARYQRFRVSHSRAGGSEKPLRYGFGFSYEDQQRQDNAVRSSSTVTLDAFGLSKLQKGSYLRYGLALSKTDSQSSEMAHSAATLSLSYIHREPIFNARASFSGLYQARHYDRLRYGTTKRQDHKLSLSANFLFSEIDYFGFSPSLTLRATRNMSNKTFFDNQELGLAFGIKSTF